jgi:hypothetical protein
VFQRDRTDVAASARCLNVARRSPDVHRADASRA